MILSMVSRRIGCESGKRQSVLPIRKTSRFPDFLSILCILNFASCRIKLYAHNFHMTDFFSLDLQFWEDAILHQPAIKIISDMW